MPTKPTQKVLIGKERGQGLVELALVLPILLMMFLGLIEVGWAIRGHLTLLIGNWNVARYGARNDVELNEDYFSILADEFYNTVDLPLTLSNSSLRLTVVTFEVGEAPCDVSTAQVTEVLTHTVGITRGSYINVPQISTQVAQKEAEFQCEVYTRNSEIYWNKGHQLLIVEAFYDQPLLLGFPLFTILLSDYVPLRTHTHIRKL
jgi:hypothetical protein